MCSRKAHLNMEKNERMSKRFWLLGLVGLVSVALLVACGSNYNPSTNGLVLIGSQGSSVIQTFSFNLNSGHVASIANSTNDTGSQTCILNGSPASMVVHPSGAYAYVIFKTSSQCPNATHLGIAVFQIKSDGTIAQVGSLVPDPSPVSLSMDAAGKFLFVAEGGGVAVYAIGGGGATLTAASGGSVIASQAPNIVAVAATATVFPGIGINGQQNSCSALSNNPPASQYLYAVDSNNYVVWEFAVDTTTGALGAPQGISTVPGFPTDAVPAGVAVDPCDRFVYVTGSLNNRINAYTICTTVIANGVCPIPNGALVQVSGSPFSVSGSANGLGPLVVDPSGKNVYALGTLSNTLSGFTISSVSGSLTPLNPATVATGSEPKAIAIRGDDNWMFVTNYGSATVSQYAITPATGALSVEAPIQTDNLPFGVAVK